MRASKVLRAAPCAGCTTGADNAFHSDDLMGIDGEDGASAAQKDGRPY